MSNKNHHRQGLGELCIRHRKELVGNASVELHDEDVVDLVTDAMHFAVSKGMDLDAIIRMAKGNLLAELRGEG